MRGMLYVVLLALTTGSADSAVPAQTTPGQPQAVPPVTLGSFDGGDAAARSRVLDAISSRRLSPAPADVERVLRAGLMDSDSSVRLSALNATLSRAAAPRLSPDPAARATWSRERGVLQALRPFVIQALQDPAPELRRAAVLALGNISLSEGRRPDGRFALDQGTIETLFQTFLIDSDGRVRTEIVKAFALGDYDTPEVRVVIERALDDERPGVRQYGAMGAGRLQLATVLPRLVERLADAEPGVRGAAAAALRRFGPALKEHRAAIARAQSDEKNPNIREELGQALKEIDR